MVTKATNAYGAFKRKRTDIKIKTADYTLQDHIDDGSTFSNKGATGPVELQLPAAIPGNSATLVIDTACPFRAQPATGEQVSASAGTLLVADKYVTCSTVGARISLVCENAGEWKAEDPVGSWVSE